MDAILNSCVNLSALYNEYLTHIEIIHRVFDSKTNEATLQILDELINKIDDINKRFRMSKIESSFNQIK